MEPAPPWDANSRMKHPRQHEKTDAKRRQNTKIQQCEADPVMMRTRTRHPVRFFSKTEHSFRSVAISQNVFHARLPSNIEVGQFKTIATAMKNDALMKHSACHEK